MVKVGDRVSLFQDIGKQGVVQRLISVKMKKWFVGGSAGNTWRVAILWEDGTQGEYPVTEVMRVE